MVKLLHDTILMQVRTDADGGSGSTGGAVERNAQIDQWIATNKGVNPYNLDDATYRRYAAESGINPGAVAGEINAIAAALPPNLRENGVQIDEFHWLDPATNIVYELGAANDGSPSFRKMSITDSKNFLNTVATSGGGSGGSGGGSTARLASDDPRYWANLDREFQLEVQKLAAQLQNNGLDAESARQQALATLIANRNNTAGDTARISADVAAEAARFAANPRDAVAELMYRNQVGGSTPFGDMTNDNFGEYGKALAAKAESIFSPVNKDLQQLRTYRDAIPPVDYFGAETRGQLGLPPTPAQALTGAQGSAPATPPPAEVNGLQVLMDRLNSMNPQEQEDFRTWTTATAPKAMAKGGQINFDGIFETRSKDGYSPSSSEGGLNQNIHERAIIVGESGQIYATLGERRPDGSIRAEQLQIKPLPSEKAKDKKLEEGNKAIVESQKKTLAAFAQGGTVNATPDDFMEQLRKYLGGLGGAGGGTGATSTPLPSARLLAGDPWNELQQDPDAMAYTQAGFSALGISPESLQATVKRFTPNAPMNNFPRVNFA